ncbi:Histidine kinase [Pedobacter steynii]|uniref:Histidine kinase n=1 Tax=Pedobacter steynii TaxID=430522 RepID=A0A1G9JB12_9SPHI|nr:sensor histidine kinase [Pedobacter steynii]NQX38191.1 sensor histidine kinase [Pedobacter steynii]SDL34393.1 Histidine kinase [Pedobacter steynii]
MNTIYDQNFVPSFMTPFHFLRSRIFYKHLAFWIIYWLYEISLVFILEPKRLFWTETILMAFLNISVFYFCTYWALPQHKPKIPIVSFLVKIMILMVCYILIKTLMSYLLIHLGLSGNKTLTTNLTFYIVGSIWRLSYFIFLGTAFWFARMSILSEKRLRIKENEEQSLKNSILNMKLSFLKAQINPHFLFNTLSFLYSKSLDLSNELAKGIITLSEIMRYSLKDVDYDGKSLLSEETKHIKNLILMNNFRFQNQFNFNFRESGVKADHKIVPLILITLIENAMKFGEITDPENPVDISLEVENNQLSFSLTNKKKPVDSLINDGHGIGIKYILYKLENYYPDKFSLDIKNEEKRYTLSLKIAL